MKKGKLNIVTVALSFGSVILVCILILSYVHTAALFERAGYMGVLAHIGVVGFELTFILGITIKVWSKWMGETAGKSSTTILLLGVAVNLYSNITSGIAKDGKPLVFTTIKGIQLDEAVLIGALIPLLFVAAEQVVADAIHKHRTAKQTQQTEESQQEKYDEQLVKVEDVLPVLQEVESLDKPVEKVGLSAPEEQLGLQRLDEVDDTEKVDAKTQGIPQLEPQEITQEAEQEIVQNIEQKTPVKKKKNSRHSTIKKAFEKYVEDNGKRPGRIRLSREAKCSESEAQTFLTQLKQQQIS